jgi:hypothetical protein
MEIINNGELIFKKISIKDLPEGLSFFSNPEDFLQIGSWNYPSKKILQRHFHRLVNRSVNRTHEIIIVLEGSLKAQIYTLEKEFVKEVIINSFEVGIMLNCAHGYEIIEDGTKVIEIKNGPYMGPEMDRMRF